MIEISAYCPKPTQIGAHLRIVVPLWDLRKQYPGEIRVSYEKDCDLYRMMQADIVILQRPFSDACVQIARMAKLADCKIWLDWDDDLTSISSCNKAWEFYQFPGLADNLATLQDLADKITVSTECLAGVYSRHPNKVVVVPNSIEDRLIPDEPPTPTRKAVMWRGSESHMHDLATYRDAMIRWAEEFSPGWQAVFFGKDPALVLHGMPEGSWHNIPEVQYYEMMSTLRKFAAPIHIVPLADTKFNRGKSNLAYLEATVAGSAVLAPNWPEWQRPGVVHYDDPASFAAKLAEMTENLDFCRQNNAEAFDYVARHHALSAVNDTRWVVIENLTYNIE